jgi:hypothetical protein
MGGGKIGDLFAGEAVGTGIEVLRTPYGGGAEGECGVSALLGQCTARIVLAKESRPPEEQRVSMINPCGYLILIN